MTPEEKIDKMYDVVMSIAPMVKDHHNVIYGNGKPGVYIQVDRNTRWINGMGWALSVVYAAVIGVIAWTFKK